MVRNSITLLALLATATALGGDFTFSAKGYFSDETSGIQFGPSWDSNHALTRLPSGAAAGFTGPVFNPGQERTVESLPVEIDIPGQSCAATTIQRCGEFKADVTKTFKLVNGGVLAKLSWKPSGRPAQYWISFPQKLFAGKDAHRDGERFALPAVKTPTYTLCQGKGPVEFRFALSDDLELGLKLLSGVASYSLNDCRHLQPPNPNFSLSLTTASDNLSYFLCLLKPGQPFPPSAPAAAPATTKRNLLGAGSDFEVGPYGFVSSPMPAKEPGLDSAVFHQGRHSLKLSTDSPRQGLVRDDKSGAWFLPVKLDPAKTYTLSAWMKSNSDKGVRVGLYCTERNTVGWGKVGHDAAEFLVTKAWKRYSHTFKPSTYGMLNHRCVTLVALGKPGGEPVWIDEVQLEEGDKASDYMAEPFEFGAVVEQPYKLFTPEQLANAAFTLRFRNNTASRTDRKINYAVRDYWDKEVAKGVVAMDIPAGSDTTVEVKIPKLPCGYYRANFDSADGTLHDEAIFGVHNPLTSKDPSALDWPLAYQSESDNANPAMRADGFGWARLWHLDFKTICPEPGKFDFTQADAQVERYETAGFKLMAILGYTFNELNIPDWAADSSRGEGALKRGARFPKMDVWKAYVKAVTSHYKGRVKAWEVLNESCMLITPEEYVPYLQAAYEVAHAADPDCLIVGGSTTSDQGQRPAPWTTRMLELDSARSFDVLSVHMYSNVMPERFLGVGADKFLTYLRDKMREHGKDLPIWHTEKAYATGNRGYSFAKHRIPSCYPSQCISFTQAPDFRAKAEYMLRETLIDSAVGKGPFFWFEDLVDRSLSPRVFDDEFGHTEYDGSPYPEILAANGLARMLEGRSAPKELVKFGANRYCALHEGPQGTLAALWDITGKSTLKLPPDIGEFTLHDFFGEPMPKEELLRLGTTPVYLRFDGKDAATVKALLLKSEGDGPQLSFSGGPELENGSLVFASYVFNKTWNALRTDCVLKTPPPGWSFKAAPERMECAPESFGRAAFPVVALKPSATPQNFAVSAGRETGKLAMPPFNSEDWLKAVLSPSTTATAPEAAPGTIAVDGDLSEWSAGGLCGAATAAKVKTGRMLWKDPLDLSCEARFRWDKDNLYLGVTVYDNVVERHSPAKTAWCTDCVELFLGFAPGAKKQTSDAGNTMSPADFQIVFAPGMESGGFKEATAWCCQRRGNAGIKVVSKRFALGYTLEAAIPWQAFHFTPTKGAILGMGIQAGDCDAPAGQAEKKIYWTGNEANCQRPDQWGALLLK